MAKYAIGIVPSAPALDQSKDGDPSEAMPCGKKPPVPKNERTMSKFTSAPVIGSSIQSILDSAQKRGERFYLAQ
jgi:hypothetical protein